MTQKDEPQLDELKRLLRRLERVEKPQSEARGGASEKTEKTEKKPAHTGGTQPLLKPAVKPDGGPPEIKSASRSEAPKPDKPKSSEAEPSKTELKTSDGTSKPEPKTADASDKPEPKTAGAPGKPDLNTAVGPDKPAPRIEPKAIPPTIPPEPLARLSVRPTTTSPGPSDGVRANPKQPTFVLGAARAEAALRSPSAAANSGRGRNGAGPPRDMEPDTPKSLGERIDKALDAAKKRTAADVAEPKPTTPPPAIPQPARALALEPLSVEPKDPDEAEARADLNGLTVLPNSRALTRFETGDMDPATRNAMKIVVISAATAALVASLAAAGISVALLRPDLLQSAQTTSTERTGEPSGNASQSAREPVVADALYGRARRERAPEQAPSAQESPSSPEPAKSPGEDIAAGGSAVAGDAASPQLDPAGKAAGLPGVDRDSVLTTDTAPEEKIEPAATVVVPELPRLMAAAPKEPEKPSVEASAEEAAAPAAEVDPVSKQAVEQPVPAPVAVATLDPEVNRGTDADVPQASGPPRIETSGELAISPGVPAHLPLRMSGAPNSFAGHSVLVVGFTRGARLSRGTSLMFDTWQIPATEIADTELTLPTGLSREIPVQVELRRPDGLVIDSRTMDLKTPGNPSALGLSPQDFAKATAAVADGSPARALTLRAERLIDNGDPLSARIPLARAAEAGAPLAAWMLALSFDPATAGKLGVPSDATDAGRARRYYDRAAELGLAPR